MMAGDKWAKERTIWLPPFVPFLVGTLESLAWIAMSHGAKAHSIGLKRRYFANNYNNSRIFLSQRSKELSYHNQIARRFREHQHSVFVVVTQRTQLRPLLVKRRDAARMLGNVTTTTIRRLEKDGLLHPVRINPRSPVAMVFFKYDEIVALAHGQLAGH
jgi:hypothetical protein